MKRWQVLAILLISLCVSTPNQSKPLYRQTGTASWYGTESGSHTANGERWQPNGLTGASWYVPFNTKVRVTHLKNGKSVIVRVNDRGPAKRLHRIIDVSRGAANKIDLLHSGVGRVLVEEVR